MKVASVSRLVAAPSIPRTLRIPSERPRKLRPSLLLSVIPWFSILAAPMAQTVAERQIKLLASDGAASDSFGSVALSWDTAVIGAYGDDGGRGSAYAFVRSAPAWGQQAKLVASDGAAGDQFGGSVALSGDTAVVGALSDDITLTDQGSAYVFVRSGMSWSQQAKLVPSDADSGDIFGIRVAISGDTAVVGAIGDDFAPLMFDRGSAYVFVRSGTSWSQQAKLIASDGDGSDNFGISVAISGNTIVIGAHRDVVFGMGHHGSAYVFVRSGTSWSQQAKLVASDGAAGDEFGRSAAIYGDTAVIGAHGDDGARGSAYVFVRSGTSWSQQAKLVASDGAALDLFGGSAALYENTAVVGASGDDLATANQGSAYVFVRSGTSWSQRSKLVASDGDAGDNFGVSVAISGNNSLVGAHLDDVAGADQGSAYLFPSLLTWRKPR